MINFTAQTRPVEMKKAPAVVLFLLVVLASCADLRMGPERDELPEGVPLRIQEIISNECKLCHNPTSNTVLRGQEPYFADSTAGDLNIEVIIQTSERIAFRVNEETMPRNFSDPFGDSLDVFRPLNEQDKSLLVRWPLHYHLQSQLKLKILKFNMYVLPLLLEPFQEHSQQAQQIMKHHQAKLL